MPSKVYNGRLADSTLTVSYTDIQVASDGATAKITSPKLAFYSKSGWSDSSNAIRVRGGAVNNATLASNVTLNGGTKTWNATAASVALVYGSTTVAHFIGEAGGVSFFHDDTNSNFVGPDLSITFPARAYSAPAAPTVVLNRTSDSAGSVTVSGNQNTATADKYWQFLDWELQTDGGSWVSKSAVAGSSTSIAVSGLSANHRYRVRVRSRNANTSSAWVTSDYIFTTPSTPSAATAARSGVNILVSATTDATYRTGLQFERSENGGIYGNATNITSGTSWTHTSPANGSTWRYRVRTFVTFTQPVNTSVYPPPDPTVTLYSGWRETATLPAAYTTPDVPTIWLSRTSDSVGAIGVSGNENSTAPKYWQYLDWQLQTDSGSWVAKSAVAGSSTSIAVSGLVANHRYRVQVRARNASSSSAYVASDYIFTTPGTPSSASASASGANNVVAAAVDAPWRTGIQVERSQDGGAWGNSVNVSGSGLSWTHAGASRASTWRYRVRTYVTFNHPTNPSLGSVSAPTTLYSAWRETGLLPAVTGAPTNVSATRGTGDGQHVLKWANPSGTVTNLVVERQTDTDTATWSTLATLGVATSYTDSTTSGNHRYRYRVKTRNASGDSLYATSSWVVTTPSAPSGLASVRSGMAITSTWTSGAPYRTGTQIERSSGGETYTPLASVSAATVSYSDEILTPLTQQYRVRHVVENVPLSAGGTTTLYSSWVTGVLVGVMGAPHAPKVNLVAVIDVAIDAQTVTVAHNSTDTTAQTAAEVRIKQTSDTTWTTVTLTTATSYTWTAGTLTNGATYEVQARTRGEHPDWGPWSASVLFTASATPSATIISPVDGVTVTTARISTEISYFDPEGTPCAGVEIRLLDGGLETLWQSSFTNVGVVPVPRTLADGGIYTVQARVRDGSGLWSPWASSVFDVDYPVPPEPVVVLTWNVNQMAVDVMVEAQSAGPGQDLAVLLSVYRFDGVPLVENAPALEDGVPQTLALVDRLAPLDVPVEYCVEATTAIGAQVTAIHSVDTVSQDRFVLNTGAGWSDMAWAKGNPQLVTDTVRERTLHRFEGDMRPVEFTSTDRGGTRSWQFSATIARDDGSLSELISSRESWHKLAYSDPPCCARFPGGGKHWVSLGAVRTNADHTQISGLSISFIETNDQEQDYA